ncbi:MAG: acyltransferase [Candidatus Thorarchaeota archaeon]
MTDTNVIIGRDVIIHPSAQLLAKELVIGDFSKIGKDVIISGGRVEIGREAWITTDVLIGGGRAEMGSLQTGDFLHLGQGSMVNTANEVIMGDEVGIGMDGRVFSHGTYLSEYDGFPYQDAPVKIGSNVWMPYAIVNPGITIGNNVVVAAMSLINRDLPSGCLAGGIPVKLIRENMYPRKISQEEKIRVLDKIINEAQFYGIHAERDAEGTRIELEKTVFDVPSRKIEGLANERTDIVKDLLRRHGIRFRFYNNGTEYSPWD